MEYGYCARVIGKVRCDHPAEVMVKERHVGVGPDDGDVVTANFWCSLHTELRSVEAPGIERVSVTRLV
jgi:hypothetical protein